MLSRCCLERIDVAARRRGISRDRFVVQAWWEAVKEDLGQWPEGLFELELSGEKRALLESRQAQPLAAVRLLDWIPQASVEFGRIQAALDRSWTISTSPLRPSPWPTMPR